MSNTIFSGNFLAFQSAAQKSKFLFFPLEALEVQKLLDYV